MKKVIVSRNINKKIVLATYFFIFCLTQLNYTYSAEVPLKEKSFILAKNCLKNPGKVNCQKAIVALEVLQLDEGSREQYSCQSRILALQSDLIISMKRLKGNYSKLNLIKELEQFCF